MSINTKVIFDFKFVNRTKEKLKIKDFIKNNDNNILWIDGPHGVGKTYLIKNIISENSLGDINFIYVNKPADNRNLKYIEAFITSLSQKETYSFSDYILENFDKIFDEVDGTFETLNQIPGAKIISLLFNQRKKYIQIKNSEKCSSTNIVMSYLLKFIQQKITVIIFDNFTYCDLDSLKIIEEIIMKSISNPNIRYIICTTTEERKSNESVEQSLCENFNNIYIFLAKLNDEKYFEEILSNVFTFSYDMSQNIKNIYSLCEGIPENLKTFVRELYLSNGISIANNNYYLIDNEVQKIINKKIIKFDPEKLDYFEKKLLEIITFWNRPITISILDDFFDYICNKTIQNSFLYKELKHKYQDVIKEFLNTQICKIEIQNDQEILAFDHDDIYRALNKYFTQENQSASTAYTHYLILKYLLYIKDKQSELSEDDLEILIAEQAYECNDPNWENYNLVLAEKLFSKGEYYFCNRILAKFRKKSKNISAKIEMLMAYTFYEIGEYRACTECLKKIEYNLLETKEKGEYFLLFGKSISFLNSAEALNYFNIALDLNLSFELNAKIKYYKEMSLSEMQWGLNEAIQIFKEFYNDNRYHNLKIYLSVLRSSANIFNVKNAKEYLNEGIILAQEQKDILEEAKLRTNLGLIYCKSGLFYKAKAEYIKAIEILYDTKIFEMSYPMTDIVTIYMSENKWDEALNIIELCRIYNKSSFISIVLKTNEMICYMNLGQLEKADFLKTELLDSITKKEIIDYKMIKKISLNCACVAYKIGDIQMIEDLLNQCVTYVINTNNQNRFYNLCKLLDYIPSNIYKVSSDEQEMYGNLKFEPWIVTFGHD